MIICSFISIAPLFRVRRTDYGRLGLLTGEDGQIIARFIAYCSGQDALLERDEILQTVQLPFRDRTFPCPRGYDKLLRQKYGDYMNIPDDQEREAHPGELYVDD